jgi:hypothetical protein
MDHDVKRVVAAGVASIHVLLQQNYARRAATNYPGCWKRLEGRGDVARHRSCAVMRPHNIDCAIFSGGCVEWIRQTQLDDTNISTAVCFAIGISPSQACRRILLLRQRPSTEALVHLATQADLRIQRRLEGLGTPGWRRERSWIRTFSGAEEPETAPSWGGREVGSPSSGLILGPRGGANFSVIWPTRQP